MHLPHKTDMHCIYLVHSTLLCENKERIDTNIVIN